MPSFKPVPVMRFITKGKATNSTTTIKNGPSFLNNFLGEGLSVRFDIYPYSFFPNKPCGLARRTITMMMTVDASAIAVDREYFKAK